MITPSVFNDNYNHVETFNFQLYIAVKLRIMDTEMSIYRLIRNNNIIQVKDISK